MVNEPAVCSKLNHAQNTLLFVQTVDFSLCWASSVDVVFKAGDERRAFWAMLTRLAMVAVVRVTNLQQQP